MAIPCLWLPLLFLVTLGVLYGVGGIREARIQRRLRREGIETKAVVVGHWVMRNAYYVTYRYDYQGQSYKRQEQVGSSKYQIWPRGTKISVRYLPKDPSVIRIAGEENHYLFFSFFFLAGAVLLVSMVIVLGLPWHP